MEIALRAALLRWLRNGPAPLDQLTAVEEEAPARATTPWLAIAASASTDWSTKDRAGREIRLAVELHLRGSEPESDAALVRAVAARIEDLPRQHSGFHLTTVRFLRARSERRSHNRRATLLEYRIRCLSNDGGNNPITKEIYR
ncbi:tail completion protein gp17 [Tsuneonella suprasediminis]|uniref:tail completion protein gp17 n=1 Tax=Tsuneonella suprasediminis TaxID=2306996 RepID=UPI002F91D1A7